MTAVLNRDVFDAVPAGVESEEDVQRWHRFREQYHHSQQLWYREDFPLQVDFELNSTCQMRCAFCTHGQKTARKVELPFYHFAHAIEEAEKHDLCSIKLNYINEPLLRKDLSQFIRYARAHGVLNVYFSTNGIGLTREVGKELIDAKLSKIMVSLDATTAKTYQEIRRSPKFLLIESNVRGFIALRKEMGASHPIVRVNFLQTLKNLHESEAFVERWTGVADSIGFQKMHWIPGMDYGKDDAPANSDEEIRCSFPFKLLVVDSGGHILPCCTFHGRDMRLGHIGRMTLAEAWRSPRMVELRELHSKGKGAANPACAHCRGVAP